jgi:outer membrane murein-binding lipoprotein Lpp
MSTGDAVAIISLALTAAGLAVSVVVGAVHVGRKIGSATEAMHELAGKVEGLKDDVHDIQRDVKATSDGLLALRTEHETILRNGGCMARHKEL